MTGIETFIKKPVEIQAIQFTDEESGRVIIDWVGATEITIEWTTTGGVISEMSILTLEGNMKISPNDWVIRGVKGEFYPCKPDIFEETYRKKGHFK